MLLDQPLVDDGPEPIVMGNAWHGKLSMPSSVYGNATISLDAGGAMQWPRPLSQTETVILRAHDAPDAPAATVAESSMGMEWRNYLLYGSVFPYSTQSGHPEGIDVLDRSGIYGVSWLWQPTFGVTYLVQVGLDRCRLIRLGVFGGAGYSSPSLITDIVIDVTESVLPDLQDLTIDGGSALLYKWNSGVYRIDLGYVAGAVSAVCTQIKPKEETQDPYFGNVINVNPITVFKPLQTLTLHQLSSTETQVSPCPQPPQPDGTSTKHVSPVFNTKLEMDGESPALYDTGSTVDYRYIFKPFFGTSGIEYIWYEHSTDITTSIVESSSASGYVEWVCSCSGGGCTYTNNGISGHYARTNSYSFIRTNRIVLGESTLVERTYSQSSETITSSDVVMLGNGVIALSSPSNDTEETITGDSDLSATTKSLYVTVAYDVTGYKAITKSPISNTLTVHAVGDVPGSASFAYNPVTNQLLVDEDNLIGWI